MENFFNAYIIPELLSWAKNLFKLGNIKSCTERRESRGPRNLSILLTLAGKGKGT